jgi:hypothetical protein
MKLLIFSTTDSPRLQYSLSAAFRQILRTDYQLCFSPDEYLAFHGPKINYSAHKLANSEIHIIPDGLLSQTGISRFTPTCQIIQGMPALFPDHTASDTFGFDLFSMLFFCLSRYEEYWPGHRDAHGRYPAARSTASNHQFLHFPLIDRWLLVLAARLAHTFPGFRIAKPGFRYLPSFDVDQAWAYRYKSQLLSMGGIIKDGLKGDAEAVKRRKEVLAGRREDPFFTFVDIEEWHRNPKADPIFFFHLGDYGKFDKNTPHHHPMLQTLVSRLAAAHRCGIHPSWKAATNKQQLMTEIERYRNITGNNPTRSRQHFLRLEFPATYQWLINAGINEDYTMGYAEVTGFRASTAKPFFWYDLSREQSTELLIIPFSLMDVTLKTYLKLSPEAALDLSVDLLETTQACGGTFCTIWHNSSLSEIGGWKTWRTMYRELSERAHALI